MSRGAVITRADSRSMRFTEEKDHLLERRRTLINIFFLDSGCGSVGRAVASNARCPRFETCHRQTFITDIHLFTVNCIEKTKIKKKRPRIAHFLNKYILRILVRGGSGGVMVTVLAFYSDNLSSNPTKRQQFFCKMLLEKNKSKQKYFAHILR